MTLEDLIKHECMYSEIEAKNRVLVQVNNLQSSELAKAREKISFLEQKLMKLSNFEELQRHYLRTINELNARIAELERSRSTLSKKCRDLGQLLQDYFDNRDNRKEQEVTT